METRMEPRLEPLKFASSSQMSVRLSTFDGELPVVIVVERSSIDDYFRLTSSTDQQRLGIVNANLDAIAAIAEDRHRRRMWSEGQSNWAGRKRQIVLRLEDLSRTQLHLPNKA